MVKLTCPRSSSRDPLAREVHVNFRWELNPGRRIRITLNRSQINK